MKRTKQILAMLLCAVLLVTGTVAVTVAYLTSTTEVVTNTFTVGKVNITLDEADVNEYGEKLYKTANNKLVASEEELEEGDSIKMEDGEAVSADRVLENEYKLIPGHEYVKDPEVRVLEESEVCWVFIKVTNGISGIEDSTSKIAEQIVANNWIPLLDINGQTVENVYYYNQTVDARNTTQKLPVFANFKLASNADVSTYDSASIKIDAYAVQADGFGTAAAAWDAAPGSWEN